MVKTSLLLLLTSLGLFFMTERGLEAQESPEFHVVVNMVQLNVAVTEKNGKYITGLKPKDFAILEDGIAENAATFAEGNEAARSLVEVADQQSPSTAAGDP